MAELWAMVRSSVNAAAAPDASFSDVRVVAGGDETVFHCHRAILASKSTFFRSAMLEKEDGIVRIGDVSGSLLTHLLGCLYVGSSYCDTEVPNEEVANLLFFAGRIAVASVIPFMTDRLAANAPGGGSAAAAAEKGCFAFYTHETLWKGAWALSFEHKRLPGHGFNYPSDALANYEKRPFSESKVLIYATYEIAVEWGEKILAAFYEEMSDAIVDKIVGEDEACAEDVDDDDALCGICGENKKRVLVRPCNHLYFCNACALAYRKQNRDACPMCRRKIDTLETVFG